MAKAATKKAAPKRKTPAKKATQKKATTPQTDGRKRTKIATIFWARKKGAKRRTFYETAKDAERPGFEVGSIQVPWTKEGILKFINANAA